MAKVTRTKNVITLELDGEFEAQHMEVALKHRQWVSIRDSAVRIARSEPEPTVSDHDRLLGGGVAPIYPVVEGKQPVPVQMASHPEYAWHDPSCIVQHIGAGGGGYVNCYHRIVSVGFVLLRSPRGAEDRYWEMWYLPGMWALEGELKGEKDRQKLVRWLFDHVAPGNVNFFGEGWALSWG